MIAKPRTPVNNRFLDSLHDKEFELLSPHLKHLHFPEGHTLYEENDTIEYVYFPLTCVISLVAVMNDGATVEVSLLGRENVVGIVTIFGEYRARNWTRVLIPGDALQMPSAVLRELFREHENFQAELMHCYRRIIAQVSQRAVCSCRHTIMQRLCCWLLMVHDRVGADDFPLTQDAIAGRLGARRAGITQAAGMLQSLGAIRYQRGKIHIADRSIIESAACECYLTYKADFAGDENCAEAAEAVAAKASLGRAAKSKK
jgi:CRP-like cAMP-binding protein